MKQHIQLLIGTIASGKSTYSRDAAALGFIIVNDDAIVNAVHGGNYKLYKSELKPLYKSIENHILTTAISLGKSVVIDRGVNNRIDSRKRWVGLASSLDTPIVAVTFPFTHPDIHAERRQLSDDRGLSFDEWRKVAERHTSDYEHATLGEGFKYLYFTGGLTDILEKHTIMAIVKDFCNPGEQSV